MGKIEALKRRVRIVCIVAIICCIGFCIIAVASRGISPDTFPSNFLGAGLGALLGAVITFVLLAGQTSYEVDLEENKRKLEEDKIRNIRILKMKTKIFQEFINSVWKVWEDQPITLEKFEELTRQYYQNLMIYLKDKSKLEAIGEALTEMGGVIDDTTNEGSDKLRKNIVDIINILSGDIGLGGEINTEIMDKHDEIIFPIRLKKELLNKLNEALCVNDNNSPFKKGKYDPIWEGKSCVFITFELRKYDGIKLAIGEIGALNALVMVFMADRAIQDIEKYRDTRYNGRLGGRLVPEMPVSNPMPNDEDKTKIPALNFSNAKSMEDFRKNPNYPDILSKRVLCYLDEWKNGDLGYIEFFEDILKQRIRKKEA